MRILWKLEKAFLKDIVDAIPEPKPAYTTISTVVKVLVKKDFVTFESFGKSNLYRPLVSKKAYFGRQLSHLINNFFDGSTNSFASLFTDTQEMSLEELESVKALIDKKINELKDENE